jgi:hypothetical protein
MDIKRNFNRAGVSNFNNYSAEDEWTYFLANVG